MSFEVGKLFLESSKGGDLSFDSQILFFQSVLRAVYGYLTMNESFHEVSFVLRRCESSLIVRALLKIDGQGGTLKVLAGAVL